MTGDLVGCAFTENHYREILESFLAAGYRFTSFADFDERADRQVILRHDVDLSLDEALRIARIDKETGVTSVFHILATADVYNPWSASGQAALRELRSLGHRIGLHVDGSVLDVDGVDANSRREGLKLLFQAAQLALGPLDSYSLHRPASCGNLGEFQPQVLPFAVPPYAHAFGRIEYRSDSRREWRHGCVCGQVRNLAGRSLQLAIHPVWWPAVRCTREELLRRFKSRQQHLLETYLGRNLSFYRPCLDEGSVEPSCGC
jgi:hypothetical protein